MSCHGGFSTNSETCRRNVCSIVLSGLCKIYFDWIFSHFKCLFFCRMLYFGDTQVHGNPGGFTRVPDRGIPHDGSMRCGYHQPVLFIFQLGFSILTRPNMEADNKVSL